jgi:sugar phosphate isomerase/epimerase
MFGNYKLGACLPTFASCADRYCLSGYGRGETTVEGMLAAAKKVDGLDGLELVGNWHINDQNIGKMLKLFRDNGLAIPMIVPDLWTQAKWGRGSLAAADPATRKAGIAEVKKCMDWAAEAACPFVDVWLGQDGYDYPFEADYSDAWKWMKDGVAECAGHSKKVKVLVEYKLREPRNHCFMSSAAKTILLIQGVPNTGCLLDVGHALAAGECMAEAVALLSDHGILDYVHLNDNHRDWDDDLIPGTVHVPEFLELAYWLLRSGYKGWLTLDIFPYREEKIPAAVESFEWIRHVLTAVQERGLDAITEIVRRGEGTDSVRLVREMLGGRSRAAAGAQAGRGR